MKQKRNGSIDFWRFVFSVVIVLFHFSKNVYPGDNGPFIGGAIAVEFFFLVSGFLMAASSAKLEGSGQLIGTSTRKFLLHKIKGMCPEYIVAWFAGFIVLHLELSNSSFRTLFKDFMIGILELLFLRSSGLTAFRANAVTWYISAMILAMLLLYPLLLKNRDLFLNVLAPAISIFILGYLCVTIGHLRRPTDWLGFCYQGTLRALAELCLGCICWNICQKLKTYHYTRTARICFSLAELGGYLCILAWSFQHSASRMDFVLLLVFAVTITISFSHESLTASLFDHPLIYWLGKISFPMFLAHGYWTKRFLDFFPDRTSSELLLFYVIAVVLTTFLIQTVSSLLRKIQPIVSNGFRKAFFAD